MSLTARLSKVLIANRGEIACRVIRSAKRLGVKTVAVYSDADVQSMHVSMADEAYNIGRPPAQESYLRGSRIIEVAKKSGAVGIHPGYGFLSENAEFAGLCKEAGIVFIGPPESAIRDMGIKSTSKAIMSAAGVPVIPGYHGDDQSDATLKHEAEKIGYPLMVKAVRGGGGKGMRIIRSAEEFAEGLESARREALRSFGDDAVLLERYVARPRHVEVQVFGDTHGNYVHLYERDCSVQRRHQKIIEQAPAPGLSDEIRSELGAAAVRAAKAVNYVGAGTVEFIMDTSDNKFYFMEMNTRLQVEHPVTEMITGVDLVEWQLRVASGEKLPMRQEDIPLKGHSVEARLYAEDVPAGFLPTAGHLRHLRTPSGPNMRIETGVAQGDDVSVHYDPMVAKLVVWHEDATGALIKLEKALSEFNIVGVENNIDFLRRLCKHKEMQEGNVHTGFIDEHKESLLEVVPSQQIFIQAAMAVVLQANAEILKDTLKSCDPFSPFAAEHSFRLNHVHTRVIKLEHQKKEHRVEVAAEGDGWYRVAVDGGPETRLRGTIRDQENGFSSISYEANDQLFTSSFVLGSLELHLFTDIGDWKLNILSDHTLDGIEQGKMGTLSKDVVSPMPGVVEKINVKPGDKVKPGDPLAVIMAMKMEYVLRAEQEATVASVLFKPGENVARSVPLIKFE